MTTKKNDNTELVNQVYLIYAGARVGKNRKRVYCYFIEGSYDYTQALYFGKRLMTIDYAIGTRISAMNSADGQTWGSFKVNTQDLVGKAVETAQVTEWSLKTKAANLELQYIADAKKGAPGEIETIVNELKSHIKWLEREERKRVVRYLTEELYKLI